MNETQTTNRTCFLQVEGRPARAEQHNKPIELWSNPVIDQKINYIHNNPVEAGFVEHEYEYLYSSARDYAGNKGLIKIIKT